MNRVDRLMGYLLLFQSRGLMRAQDFAGQFEISERTVYRDIQALSEVGVPIMAMPGEGYRLMEGYYLPPIVFTPDEARALSLAVSMLTGLAEDSPTQNHAKVALDKIRAVLPEATLHQIEALQAILQFYALPHTRLNFDDNILLDMQTAVLQHRVIRLHYHAQHTNKITIRDVEPVELVFLDKIWMLSAYCRLRQAPRTFRLERIDHLEILPETFIPRDLGQRIPIPGDEELVIRFDANMVRWVRERQHFTFDREEMDNNGRSLMIYRPNRWEQIEGWLLSWGDTLEIVAPESKREMLRETADRIAQRHQKTDRTRTNADKHG
jgi:predicted DNA-binding transcriptional regulator YafY